MSGPNSLYLLRTLSCSLIFVLGATGGCKTSKQNYSGSKSAEVQPQSYKWVLNFSGKASTVGWDIGIMQEIISHTDMGQAPNTIITGNSSGSIMAAYFACHGVSQYSVQGAMDIFQSFDRTQVPDQMKKKVVKFAKYLRVEVPSDYIRGFIEQNILMDEKKTKCNPTTPLVISAVNGDVADVRKIKEDGSGGAPARDVGLANKRYDQNSYQVFSADEANPTGGESLGRGCTYFANPAAEAILRQIPDEERQCDIRPIHSYEETLLAVLASVSEPTFFYPVLDVDVTRPEIFNSTAFHGPATDPYWLKYNELNPYFQRKAPPVADDADEDTATQIHDYEKIRSWGLASTKRFYVGGYLVTNPGQDIRRVIPEAYVFSTGRPDFAEFGARRVVPLRHQPFVSA